MCESKQEQLAAHYAALPREFGFASMCRMTFAGELSGARVLDLDCRRGKGVLKLADQVGEAGFVLGCDPCAAWIDEARTRYGREGASYAFATACPEDLAAAGIADASFDVVFENSSLALAYDPAAVLAEAFRVLRPGGALIYDGVVAEGERDEAVRRAARALGNDVQAALSRAEFARLCEEAGFEAPVYSHEEQVAPDQGYRAGTTMPVAECSENVVFTKTTALVRKPGDASVTGGQGVCHTCVTNALSACHTEVLP